MQKLPETPESQIEQTRRLSDVRKTSDRSEQLGTCAFNYYLPIHIQADHS